MLDHVDLLKGQPAKPPRNLSRPIRSLINVPLRHPLPLLYFPSLAVLYATHDRMKLWAGIVLAVTWFVLMFEDIHFRFRQFFWGIRRCLFLGGQMVVSLAVIVLAVGRYLDFGYIATVAEAAFGMLATWILAAYALTWVFEYWQNRMVSDELIAFLQTGGDRPGEASYPYRPPGEPERLIQIHGGTRFLVSRGRDPASDRDFDFFGTAYMLRRLISRANNNRFGTGGVPDKSTLLSIAKDLSARVGFFFSFMNATLIAALVLLAISLGSDRQVPAVEVEGFLGTPPAPEASGEVGERFDLEKAITGSDRQRVILLAASGGGTRAALYAASVLDGLRELDALDDLVLVSGVSGGGAALAYFAAHYDELLAADKAEDQKPWDGFHDALAEPFINDVLKGASEWRISAGTRLGALLSESFERRFDSDKNKGKTFGGCGGVGVILNTALAGRLSAPTDSGFSEHGWREWVEANARLSKADVAGGRLIFTNLSSDDGFEMEERNAYDLRYVVPDASAVKLTTAAALNANFPPVFSNMAVDVGREQRFWVTDGGAVDNRGVISLLFALKAALKDRPESGPDIHIIVAEASGTTIDHDLSSLAQSRGIGSVMGASAKFASKLMHSLLEDCDELYGGTIKLHYLPMPLTFRTRGGLGTHWMLPRGASFSKITPDPEKSVKIRLGREQIQHAIRKLHLPGWYDASETLDPPDQRLEEFRSWMLGDDSGDAEHREVWAGIERTLKGGSDEGGVPEQAR